MEQIHEKQETTIFSEESEKDFPAIPNPQLMSFSGGSMGELLQ